MTLQFKEGSFVKITTDTTQVITGVGFRPKAVILYGGPAPEDSFDGNATFWIGFATSSSSARSIRSLITDFTDPTITQRHWDVDSVWNNFGGSGEGTHAEASISSFNSDGFTLSWIDNNAVQNIIHYIAIGGDDVINTAVGHFPVPSSTGNDSVTGLSFRPDLVLLFSTNNTQDVDQVAATVNQMIGCFNNSGEQAVSCIWARDNVSPSDCVRYQRTTRCVSLLETTDHSIFTHEASFSSMDSNGFTLNYSTASASAKRVAYLAIKGPRSKIGSFNSPTSGSTPVSQSISGVGLQPKGLILMTTGKTAGTSVVSHARLSFGAGDGGSGNRGYQWAGATDNMTNIATARIQESDNIVRVSTEAAVATSTTTQALANLTSLNSNGFTLSWSVRDTGNAYQILYIVFGNAGTLYERPVTGTVQINATVTKQRRSPIDLSEMPVISAIVTESKSAPRAVSASLSLTANAAKVKRVLRTAAESLEVSDAIGRFKRAIRLIFPIAGE